MEKPQASSSSHGEDLSLLLNAVEDYAIILLSPEGEILTWNTGADVIMGYRAADAIGRNFSILYDDPAKPRMELEVAQSEGRVIDEGWRIRGDGQRFWAHTVIRPIRNVDGSLRGFVKVTSDLTAKRIAEEQLRHSTEIFQLLVSSVHDYAIFMLDPEGYVTTWNAGAERIKGYTADEIIGQHFSKFYPPEDLDKPPRELEIAKEKGSVEDEGWRVRKDGTRFWANVVITAVYDVDHRLRGFAKVTRDITDRKNAEETQRALLEQREARVQAEEERRRAEDSYHAAQEANRAKDEFLMTLSHELRTPMTAILGWSRLLPSMSPADPLFAEAVTAIATAAQLQSRLIDDILDVSRVVSGKLRLAPETVDVARVVMNAVDAVNATAYAKQIALTTSFAPALGSIIADPTRLQQVIWNLLSNAVKFTPKGGAVLVSAKRTASQVVITVTDTGEGIDPQFLAHVFEPFRQAETPQTRVHGGLGLGLSIVRYIAEAHGGTVTVHSEGKGKGATFTVALPVRATLAGDTPVRPAMGETFKHGDRLRGVRIVLVDDDREARKMVAAVLGSAGAQVSAFENANDALVALETERPDLVITDIAMPEVDGYAFTRAVRQRPGGAEMKIVALSAFPPSKEESGVFSEYLTKPIDPFQLIDRIATVALRISA